MLLNLKFILEIIQKVCVFVCLFVCLLACYWLTFLYIIVRSNIFQQLKEKLSIHFRTNGEYSCSVLRCWANDGPTLNCQKTTNEKLLRNCYLSTMMAQRWPNVLYPTPTFADRTNQLPTLGQRMSAIWVVLQ